MRSRPQAVPSSKSTLHPASMIVGKGIVSAARKEGVSAALLFEVTGHRTPSPTPSREARVHRRTARTVVRVHEATAAVLLAGVTADGEAPRDSPSRTSRTAAVNSPGSMGERLSRRSTWSVTASSTSVSFWSMVTSAPSRVHDARTPRAGRRDDICTRTIEQGDCALADYSAGADDEYTLPCLKPAVVEECLTRGQRDRGESCRIRERHTHGSRDESVRRGDDVLRRSTMGRHPKEAANRLTESKALYPLIHGPDRSGNVVPGHVRKYHRDRQLPEGLSANHDSWRCAWIAARVGRLHAQQRPECGEIIDIPPRNRTCPPTVRGVWDREFGCLGTPRK